MATTLRADDTAAAAAIVDDDRPTHSLAELVSEDAPDDIDRSTGRKRHDESDGARGITLPVRLRWHDTLQQAHRDHEVDEQAHAATADLPGPGAVTSQSHDAIVSRLAKRWPLSAATEWIERHRLSFGGSSWRTHNVPAFMQARVTSRPERLPVPGRLVSMRRRGRALGGADEWPSRECRSASVRVPSALAGDHVRRHERRSVSQPRRGRPLGAIGLS